MIIARIESLILDKGLDDALIRANAYIRAGADGIMIHSKKEDPDTIFQFCEKYSNFDMRVPLVVVPSKFNTVYENDLVDAGANIIIYANNMLRSAYPAMLKVAKSILDKGRSYDCEDNCISINEILGLIPGTK